MANDHPSEVQDSWYAADGLENDVFLSTRVRLSRNLANFPFPHKLRASDGERIQAIVFDAFNSLPDGERFQAIAVNRLDVLGTQILHERDILEETDVQNAGIILRTDGKIACSVNIIDHVRITSFVSGFDFDTALRLGQEIDVGLQNKIQFAASYDFGYLTSSVLDAGSGLKLTLRLHIPSLAQLGHIGSVAEELQQKGAELSASFGSGKHELLDSQGGMGASLGAYYDLTVLNSQKGAEVDQVAAITAIGARIKEMERSAREECKKTCPTLVRNSLYRAIALMRSSIFVPLREAISIISIIKWGIDMALITGTNDSVLHALLYRIQDGHLEYVLKNAKFNFEKDIGSDVGKRNERLRALILQEALQEVTLA